MPAAAFCCRLAARSKEVATLHPDPEVLAVGVHSTGKGWQGLVFAPPQYDLHGWLGLPMWLPGVPPVIQLGQGRASPKVGPSHLSPRFTGPVGCYAVEESLLSTWAAVGYTTPPAAALIRAEDT